MTNQPRFDFDRNERRAALDRFAEVYKPPKGSCTSKAACVMVLRCIESHLGRSDRGALADEWRLTWDQIAAETGISSRSVRYAVAQLEREQVLYVTEHRATGWRRHSFRIIWGNVEAAAEVVAVAAEPEKPTTVQRGDRERGVGSAKPAPLPLAPKPLPLGLATIATRTGNHCHSIEQKQEQKQKPPPPPTPSPTECESNRHPWREVEEALRNLGIGQSKTACRDARERGASPEDIQAAIDQWRRSTGFWTLGGLAYRIATGVWPPPNRAAEAKMSQAVELRARLLEKGGELGHSMEYCRFVIGMELRRLGLADYVTPQEAEAITRKTLRQELVTV
jgi:hypothetical protein